MLEKCCGHWSRLNEAHETVEKWLNEQDKVNELSKVIHIFKSVLPLL